MKNLLIVLILTTFIACKNNSEKEISNTEDTQELNMESASDSLIYPEETHFKSMRQITFGGDNAEAYWSFDDKQIVFQSNYKDWGLECDQMFIMNFEDSFEDSKPPMVSTGKGRTTCAYFLPDNKHFVYASTHLVDEKCPEVPLRSNGKYVWPVYDSFDIFVADLEGNITAQLTNEPGYDAEATVSPKGDKIVFTSDRSGDLELYTMNIDG